MQGWSGGEADTILGYDKLVQKFSGLAGDARQLQAARKKSRRQLDELLESAKVSQNNNNHPVIVTVRVAVTMTIVTVVVTVKVTVTAT